MKAIIIQDHDAANLLDSLKLEQLSDKHPFTSREGALHQLTPDERRYQQQITEDMHRRFHYIVTRWLQEQGASVNR